MLFSSITTNKHENKYNRNTSVENKKYLGEMLQEANETTTKNISSEDNPVFWYKYCNPIGEKL